MVADKDPECRNFAEDMLDSFGFGGLVDLLKNSEVFRNRLEEVDERIQENLRQGKEKGPKVDLSFDISTLKDKSSRRTGSTRPGSKKWSPGRKGSVSESGQKQETTKEPLIDLFEGEDSVRVVALLPEVSEQDLDLIIEGTNLLLEALDYSEELQLPCPVKQEPKVRYRNGIFDILFEKGAE